MKTVLIGTSADVTTAAAQPQNLTADALSVFSVQSNGTLTLLQSGTGTSAYTDAAYSKTNGADFLIVQGAQSGKTLRTAYIKNAAVANRSAQVAYIAPVPSVYTVGYDGVTATYDMISGAVGSYGINVKNMTAGAPAFPSSNGSVYYSAASSATSIEISKAISAQINAATFLATLGEWKFAFAEVLSGASSAQLVTSGPANITGTFINGSNIVTLSGSTAGGTTVTSAGDYLRVGHATSTTAPVYKVLSISGTAVVLDKPYVNPQLAIGASVASVALGYIAAAGGIATAVSGVRVTEWNNIFNGSNVLETLPNKSMSVATTANLYGTPISNNGTVAKVYTSSTGAPASAAVATQGVGTSYQVFKEELWAAGEIGFVNRIWFPENFPLYTAAATTYDCWTLRVNQTFEDQTAQSFKRGSYGEVFIALPHGTYTVLASILANI